MSTLEKLIGKPLHLCTQQELEEFVIKGRMVREAEAEGARAKRSGGGGGRKKVEIPDFDLEEDLPEMELDD